MKLSKTDRKFWWCPYGLLLSWIMFLTNIPKGFTESHQAAAHSGMWSHHVRENQATAQDQKTGIYLHVGGSEL